ncbi:MAG: hypothetical protein GY804_09020 [Alphaproteobacteria bacterium]|nr:hypothetical protein [Alphaproteobacteria bacterium]
MADQYVTPEQMLEMEALETRMNEEFVQFDTNVGEITVINNRSTLVKSDITSLIEAITTNVPIIKPDINNQKSSIDSQLLKIETLKSQLEYLNPSLVYVYKFTMGGTYNKVYPIAWRHKEGIDLRVVCIRGINQNQDLFTGDEIPPGLVFDLEERVFDRQNDKIGYFRVNRIEQLNSDCLFLLSDKMFSATNPGMEIEDYNYQSNSYSGFYLRGALSYTIVTNDKDAILSIQDCVELSQLSSPLYVWDDEAPQVEPIAAMYNPETADGHYRVSWDASQTPEVTYILEMATTSEFLPGDVQEIYEGDLAAYTFMDSRPGTFYFRIKAVRDWYDDSDWTICENPTQVIKISPKPANLIVPGNTTTGIYNLFWSGVSETGFKYELEEATDGEFTTDVVNHGIIEATEFRLVKNELQNGVYFYRIRTVSSNNWEPSEWVTGLNSCRVEITNGDIAKILGGTEAKITTEKLSISTGTNSESSGNLIESVSDSAACSNGTLDNAVITGGSSSDALQMILLSTDITSLSPRNITTRPYLSAISSRTGDIGVATGGGDDSSIRSDREAIVISTGVDGTGSGQLAQPTNRMSSVDNGELSVALVCGSNNNTQKPQRFIIGTSAVAEEIGVLSIPIINGSAGSTGRNDLGVMSGGNAYVTNLTTARVVVSTAAGSTLYGTLSNGQSFHTTTTNGIGDIGMVSGGDNIKTALQRMVISSNALHALHIGSLRTGRSHLTSTSNG